MVQSESVRMLEYNRRVTGVYCVEVVTRLKPKTIKKIELIKKQEKRLDMFIVMLRSQNIIMMLIK